MSDDESDPKSHLRIVSDNSDGDRRTIEEIRSKAWAQGDVRRVLIRLAANVARVARGAGEPYSIGRNCLDVINAYDAYHTAFGHYPGADEIGEAMRPDFKRLGDEERTYALELMTRGALQLTASTLLRQIPQMRAGEHELLRGVRDYEAQEKASMARWEAKWAAERRASRPTVAKKKTEARAAPKRRPSPKTEP